MDERFQTSGLGGQLRPALTERARGASDIFRHLLNATNVNFCVPDFVDIVFELIDFLCGLRDGVDDNVDNCAYEKSISVFERWIRHILVYRHQEGLATTMEVNRKNWVSRRRNNTYNDPAPFVVLCLKLTQRCFLRRKLLV